jgi:hypothetical protein
MKTKNHENAWEQKRLKTFLSLKTKNTAWKHATVINYSLANVPNRKGELIEKWIPEYEIPVGYKNPYEKDVLNSKTKRCQLCDHKIIDFGVILHEEKKLFLIVGMECYFLYETDNDKTLRLRLLQQLMNEHIQAKIDEEKTIINGLFAAYETTLVNKDLRNTFPDHYIGKDWYTFTSTIRRNQWSDWSRTKFFNFLIKNSYFFTRIGYQINEKIVPMKNVVKYYKTAFKTTVYMGLKEMEKTVYKNLHSTGNGYYPNYWKKNTLDDRVIHKMTGKNMNEYRILCFEKAKDYNVIQLKEILKDDLTDKFAKYEWFYK